MTRSGPEVILVTRTHIRPALAFLFPNSCRTLSTLTQVALSQIALESTPPTPGVVFKEHEKWNQLHSARKKVQKVGFSKNFAQGRVANRTSARVQSTNSGQMMSEIRKVMRVSELGRFPSCGAFYGSSCVRCVQQMTVDGGTRTQRFPITQQRTQRECSDRWHL